MYQSPGCWNAIAGAEARGRDGLEGGGGRDVFVFADPGQDRVLDFSRGDRLEFAGADGFDDLRIRDILAPQSSEEASLASRRGGTSRSPVASA